MCDKKGTCIPQEIVIKFLTSISAGRKIEQTNKECIELLKDITTACKDTVVKRREELVVSGDSMEVSWKRDRIELYNKVLERIDSIGNFAIVIMVADLEDTKLPGSNWYCKDLVETIIRQLDADAEPWEAYVLLGRLYDGLTGLEENLK